MSASSGSYVFEFEVMNDGQKYTTMSSSYMNDVNNPKSFMVILSVYKTKIEMSIDGIISSTDRNMTVECNLFSLYIE